MKNSMFLLFISLAGVCSGQTIFSGLHDTTITGFLFWKTDTSKFPTNVLPQSNLPVGRISYKTIPLNPLTSKLVGLHRLDTILTNEDIIFMNEQITEIKKIESWPRLGQSFSIINPDTLPSPGTTFLELSIPIFSKKGQICLLASNVNCNENYCHDNLIAIYEKQSSDRWRIIKVLHHITY